jgi:hypothetical protein
VSTLTFPAYAGSATERPAKPTLLQKIGAAIMESRRRKAQRAINETLAMFGPTVLDAAGLKRISLENDKILPLT